MTTLGAFIIGKIVFYYMWDLVDRGMKYFTAKTDYKKPVTNILDTLSNNKSFINLNISEIDSIHKIYFHQYIKESMINRHDIDHIMNYFHNIVSLQNYLKANDITYTFWNTLNDIKPAVLENIKNYKHFKIKPYQHEVIFNQEDWLLFGDSEHPWLGPPWSWSLLSLDKQISEKNRHPNLEAIIELAKKVVAHISTTTET